MDKWQDENRTMTANKSHLGEIVDGLVKESVAIADLIADAENRLSVLLEPDHQLMKERAEQTTKEKPHLIQSLYNLGGNLEMSRSRLESILRRLPL